MSWKFILDILPSLVVLSRIRPSIFPHPPSSELLGDCFVFYPRGVRLLDYQLQDRRMGWEPCTRRAIT